MTHDDVVTGGRSAPARHRAPKNSRGPTSGRRAILPTVRGAIFGLVGLAMVFSSGYLVGTDTSTQATAAGSPAGSPVGPAAKSGGPTREGDEEVRRQAARDTGAVPASSSTKGSPPAEPPASTVALPASVDIPALDLREDLTGLNVVDGALSVPQEWGDVGWWQDGPTPGEQGSAVMVGHLDSPTGPAVFYGLSSLGEGDTILVRRVDGSTATFRVASTELVTRRNFPSEEVYRRDGRPTLSLLTCGGSYDEALGQYTGNVVVTAYLVDDDQDQAEDQAQDKAEDKAQDQAQDQAEDKQHQHQHSDEHQDPVREDKVVARG